METLTFLRLLILTTGATSYVCRPLGLRCPSHNYPYWVLVFQPWEEDPSALFALYRSCSGTLIHAQWILTHADCYHDLLFRIPLKVKISSCPAGSCDEIHIIPRDNIRKFRNSPDTVGAMLLKLPEPVRSITPAQLPPPPCKRPDIGATLRALGSRPNTFESDRTRIYCVDRNITACSDEAEANSRTLFCASAIGGVGPFIACPEDIGGPLLRTEGGSAFVYGVKVFSSEFLDICAPPISQWINDTIYGP